MVTGYVAVGSDGVREVIWGVGETREEAERDGARWAAEAHPVPELRTRLVDGTVLDRVRRGDVAWQEEYAREMDDTQVEECAYCRRDVASRETVPSVSDDEAWTALAREHDADCEWIRTRAHRRD